MSAQAAKADRRADEVSDSAQPHITLIRAVVAIWKARAIYAAARLQLADLLAPRPSTVDELARATGTHAPSLDRLLKALVSCGLFEKSDTGHFTLTPLGAALQIAAPGSARATVLTLGGDWQWTAWGHFLSSVRTGRPAMREAFGQQLFEYLACHADDSALFNEAMIGMHGADGAAVAKTYDFSPFRTLIDLGGGTGTMLAAILQHHPHLKGVLADLSEALPGARQLITAHGLSDRCEVVETDFFQSVPVGYDIYVLAHVLHDWSDDLAVTILRKCREAIPQHGRLLVVEAVLSTGASGASSYQGEMMDLLMLTMTGGVERTVEQFREVLSAGGFRILQILPTRTGQSILEVAPTFD